MLGGRVGDLRDAVVHDFRAHPADGPVREVPCIEFVGLVWTGAQLVRTGGANVANDFAEIEVVGHEFVRERLEQLRVGSGVGDADIVHWLHDASADVLGPNEVSHVFCEPRVVLGANPIGEELATVGVFALGRFPSEEFRWDNDIADGVFRFTGATVVDDSFAGIFPVFASDLGEEGDESAVVFHGPAVERMVVALGALDPDAEEGLGGVFCVLEGVGFREEEVGGWVLEVRTVSAQEACCDFVERQVVVELFLDPGVVGDDRFVVHLPLLIGRNLEEFAPLERPDVDKLVPCDEAIDEFLALGGVLVVDELFDLFAGGEDTVDIDVSAPREGGVIAQSARNEAKVLEFFVNEGVDVVLFFELWPFVFLAFRNHNHLRTNGVLAVTSHDESFAPLSGGDGAIFTELCGAFVIGEEESDVGDVSVAPVAVFGADDHFEFGPVAIENDPIGEQFDSGEGGEVGWIVGSTCLQPMQDGVVEGRAFFKAFTAGVRCTAVGFGQHEGSLWDGEVDSAAWLFARDAEVVAFGVEAPEGEAESVLTTGSPVATVALCLHEDGHDIIAEGDGRDGVSLLYLDGQLDRFAFPFDFQCGFAVGDGGEGASCHLGFCGVDDGELCFRGDVPLNTVGFRCSDDERLLVGFEGEVDLFWVDLELGCESTGRREGDERGEERA